MAKSKKLTEQELKQIQSMLNAFNQLKMQLGDAVLQQSSLVSKIDTLKKEYGEVELKLSEKYGSDSQIDVQTGEIKKIEQLSQVIMLTGHATVKTAIEGMKNGAFDYLMKPTDTDELIEMINNAYQLVAEQRDKIRQAEINNILKKRGW